jgi:hypothetical protein
MVEMSLSHFFMAIMLSAQGIGEVISNPYQEALMFLATVSLS